MGKLRNRYDFFMIHLWWVCALTLEFGNFFANLKFFIENEFGSNFSAILLILIFRSVKGFCLSDLTSTQSPKPKVSLSISLSLSICFFYFLCLSFVWLESSVLHALIFFFFRRRSEWKVKELFQLEISNRNLGLFYKRNTVDKNLDK